jgi:hypothetical protein
MRWVGEASGFVRFGGGGGMKRGGGEEREKVEREDLKRFGASGT